MQNLIYFRKLLMQNLIYFWKLLMQNLIYFRKLLMKILIYFWKLFIENPIYFQKLLIFSPDDRISAGQALTHAYFSDFGFTPVAFSPASDMASESSGSSSCIMSEANTSLSPVGTTSTSFSSHETSGDSFADMSGLADQNLWPYFLLCASIVAETHERFKALFLWMNSIITSLESWNEGFFLARILKYNKCCVKNVPCYH